MWYSFCLIYDIKEYSFAINVDGLEALKIKSEKTFKDKVVNLKSPIEVGNCRYLFLPPFSGQMADLNVWSRPLNKDEVKQFTEFCNSDVVQCIKI